MPLIPESSITGVVPDKGPEGPFSFSGSGVTASGPFNQKSSRQAVSDKATEIANLLAPTVQALELELLGVEYLTAPGGATLRLYIDVPQPLLGQRGEVDIDDCERVSREVSAQLDVEDPISVNYTLEVSSPGLDRPLFTLAQFLRHQGESAKVQLKLASNGRRRLQGEILAVDETAGEITFGVDNAPFVVSFDNIDKARIIPDWAALGLAPSKPKGPAPKNADKANKQPSNQSAAKKPRAE